MCWIGKPGDKRVAGRNITVYKVLNVTMSENGMEYEAPYRKGFQYVMGKKYKVRSFGMNQSTPYLYIDRGLHCYSQNAYVAALNFGGYISVYSGNNKDPRPVDHKCMAVFQRTTMPPVVVKCTIPKGATYYKNERGEIVTNSLILNENLGTPDSNKIIRFKDLYK